MVTIDAAMRPKYFVIYDTNPYASAKNPGVVFDSSHENTYPKHVGHASRISVICVEFEKVCL